MIADIYKDANDKYYIKIGEYLFSHNVVYIIEDDYVGLLEKIGESRLHKEYLQRLLKLSEPSQGAG